MTILAGIIIYIILLFLSLISFCHLSITYSNIKKKKINNRKLNGDKIDCQSSFEVTQGSVVSTLMYIPITRCNYDAQSSKMTHCN